MKNEVSLFQKQEDLAPLPQNIRSKDGQVVDLRKSVWTIRASSDGGGLLRINWDLISKQNGCVLLSKRALEIYKRYIVYRIERKKGKTIICDVNCISQLINYINQVRGMINSEIKKFTLDWSTFDEQLACDFLNWSIANRAGRGNDFSRLRTFYAWGVANQYPEFDPNVLRALQSVRAPGNLKGHHIRFRHKERGPLSPEERQLLVDGIKAGNTDARTRAITMLHLELGLNPQATVRLRNKDFKQISTSKGIFYQLDVPRVKKRTAFSEWKRRPISRELGDLLSQLQKGQPEDYLFFWLNRKNPEAAITDSIKAFAKSAAIISPHTGKPLAISARRLRYTLATDMAEDGASKFHIAEVLDHTDLQNVDVYVQTASTIANDVAAATDEALRPLVRRFQGRVIESTEAQVVQDQPNQIIPAAVPHLSIPLLSTGGLGVCGRSLRREGLCHKYPPLSCYTCPSFAALHRGPHKQMLDGVEAFLAGHADNADRRILNQLDDVRASIRELIESTTSSNQTDE